MAATAPDQGKKQTAAPSRVNVPGYNPRSWRRFWLVLAVLLLVNFVVTTIVESVSTPASVTIPYNVFLDQLNGGNVASITATGDSITGIAKKAVSGGSGQPDRGFAELASRARRISPLSGRRSRPTTSRRR